MLLAAKRHLHRANTLIFKNQGSNFIVNESLGDKEIGLIEARI